MGMNLIASWIMPFEGLGSRDRTPWALVPISVGHSRISTAILWAYALFRLSECCINVGFIKLLSIIVFREME